LPARHCQPVYPAWLEGGPEAQPMAGRREVRKNKKVSLKVLLILSKGKNEKK
jgi:hypothetical protein